MKLNLNFAKRMNKRGSVKQCNNSTLAQYAENLNNNKKNKTIVYDNDLREFYSS